MTKKILGIVEKVEITGEKTVKAYALFDTGAARSSVDTKLAGRAKLGPVISVAKIKHASLKREIQRPVVRAMLKVKGKMFDVKVSIQDRTHMSFPVIVGRDVLSGNFLIDPKKNKELFNKKKSGKPQSNLLRYIS